MNIREQINKLSTNLNITKKGLEVFSGERKTILPTNTEIIFGTELKKKIKDLQVIYFVYNCKKLHDVLHRTHSVKN